MTQRGPRARRDDGSIGEVLALVPARAGSKGIPNKNLVEYRGRPLVVHSIEHALASGLVRRVIVSTDSDAIADVSRRAGAEVPFRRPDQCAEDTSTDLEVFRHALAWLDQHEGYRPHLVVHLRPTTPVRPPGLIDAGVRLLADHPDADSMRTVIPAPITPYKMWRIDDGRLVPLLEAPDRPEAYNLPRQLLPPVYWQNGYLDVTRWRTVMESRSMTGGHILALVMDSGDDIDIDSLRDLRRAMPQAPGGGGGA
jgi:CMP-N,N'-diacetyllegionaminic acid synthase